jgi:flagellar FliL protein
MRHFLCTPRAKGGLKDSKGLWPSEAAEAADRAPIARQKLPFNFFLTDLGIGSAETHLRGQAVATAATAAKDQDQVEDGDEAADATAAGAPRKKWNGKRLVMFIGAPVFLLMCAVLGTMFSGILDPLLGLDKQEAAVEKKVEKKATVFFDVPELLVNLNTTGTRSSFLKITVSLELEKAEDIPRIKDVMPRILDNFQVYLRELRLDDLRGSAGMYRLREELLARVNAAVAPVKVRDILFKEMLVQ